VRGYGRTFVERVENAFDDTIRILQHVIVPEAQNQIAHRLQIPGAIEIARFGMLAAIHFNDQASGLAAEIYNVAPKRHLPTKLQTVEATVAQAEPQLPLGIGLTAPETSRYRDIASHSFSPAVVSLGHPLLMGAQKKAAAGSV